MENSKVNFMPVIIKWAAIYVIAAIVLTYTIQFLNIDPDSPVKWISTLLFIAFMLLTQKESRDINGGYLSFGEGFKSGFLFTIFSAIVLTIFTYLYFAVLSPEMVDKILSITEAKMAQKGLSQEQVDQAMGFTRKFISPIGLTIGSLISSLIMGLILSLIGAAVFKKERPLYNPSASDELEYQDPAV